MASTAASVNQEKHPMASFSDYLENKVLDHVFRNAAYTPPSSVYLGLFTAAPTDAGGGTEVSSGGYARQELSFGAAANGAIANDAAVSFTASGADFGVIVAVGIFDAETAGNLISWATITHATVSDADTLSFAVGDIVQTLD
jgi:hypothetical protein